MKKVNTRSILFFVLILASALSYIYLNTVSVPTTISEEKLETPIQEDLKDKVESEQKDIILPDVQLLRKVIQTGKRFLPASS